MCNPTEKLGISHNPDMYIVAGVGTKQLHVNSTILTEASTVFRAMFGPNFAEGASLKGSTKATKMHEQVLPEDDEEATIIVMAVLHFNMELIPEALPQESIFAMAKFAHKYNLLDVLKPIVNTRWTFAEQEPRETSLTTSEYHQLSVLLAAAYMLKLPRKFRILSNWLILCSSGLQYRTPSEEALTYLPAETLGLLDAAQMDMRIKAAILYGERAKRFKDYNNDYDDEWRDRELLIADGKVKRRSTVGSQLLRMQEWGLDLNGKVGDWFKRGLTYNIIEGTVEWQHNLGKNL